MSSAILGHFQESDGLYSVFALLINFVFSCFTFFFFPCLFCFPAVVFFLSLIHSYLSSNIFVIFILFVPLLLTLFIFSSCFLCVHYADYFCSSLVSDYTATIMPFILPSFYPSLHPFSTRSSISSFIFFFFPLSIIFLQFFIFVFFPFSSFFPHFLRDIPELPVEHFCYFVALKEGWCKGQV